MACPGCAWNNPRDFILGTFPRARLAACGVSNPVTVGFELIDISAQVIDTCKFGEDVDPGDQFVDPGFHIDPDNQDVDPGDQYADPGFHIDPDNQDVDPGD